MVLFCHLRVDRWCKDAMERPCVSYLSMKWKQFCFSVGSHRVSISLAVVQSTRLVFIFCCSGFVGMLVCILLIAKEANLKLLSIGISWISFIWCFVLLMWKRIGEENICWCGVSERNFASLKAEAFCELTTGAVNLLMDGAVGFSLQYFHLFSFDIITLVFFIFVPTFLWHIFVGSVPEVQNTFLVRNSYIFVVIILILAWILTVRHE